MDRERRGRLVAVPRRDVSGEWVKRMSGESRPNPHKALGVKRKYFPRERLPAAFFLPDVRTSVAAAAENSPRRSGLVISSGRGTPSASSRGEPHPTLMQTLAAQPRKAERLCQGTGPGRSRYSLVPSNAAIQKATGSLLEGSVPFGQAGGWGGSSGRKLLAFPRRGLAGVGRTWDGHKPSPLLWDSFTLNPLVPRPTGRPRRNYRPPRSK